MSHTLFRSKSDKRSLGIYAKPLMRLVELIAAGEREPAIVIADDIAMELRADEIVFNGLTRIARINANEQKIMAGGDLIT